MVGVPCLVVQSCPTLCNSMDYSPPHCSVLGDSPGKNTGVGCRALLQGIFATQGSNPGLPHVDSSLSEPPGKPMVDRTYFLKMHSLIRGVFNPREAWLRERVKSGKTERQPRPDGESLRWPWLPRRTQSSHPVPHKPYWMTINKNSPSRATVATLHLLVHFPLLSLTSQSSPPGLLSSCTFGLQYKALPGSYWESQGSVGADLRLDLLWFPPQQAHRSSHSK